MFSSCGETISSFRLRYFVAFLRSVTPESYLRLRLQLALAAEIPEDKQDSLVLPLTGAKKSIDLLKDEKLLERLIGADGELGDAEKNMLSEAMDKVGLVVPMKMETTDLLLEEWSENLVEDSANEIINFLSLLEPLLHLNQFMNSIN